MPQRDGHVELDDNAKLEQASIRYADRSGLTPDLSPQRVALDPQATARRIGVELSREDVVQHLQQMGHGVRDAGSGALLDEKAETGATEHRQVSGAAIGPKLDYSEIRSACQALLREFGWQLSAEPLEMPCFIPGRGARVLALRGEERRAVGSMGELHPEVLEHHKLVYPAAVFEINLEELVASSVDRRPQ